MAQRRIGRVGFVGRFKPLHRGHAAVLEALCRRADHVVVGLGSSNRYGPRHPFTAAESADMLHAVLGPRCANYRLVEVPDLGHGPRWRALVRELLGPLDLFVTGNPYVRSLLEGVYELAHPLELVPPAARVRVDGAQVRQALARGEAWEHLVPPAVRDLLEARGLPERRRRELGLVTLARELEPAGAVSAA